MNVCGVSYERLAQHGKRFPLLFSRYASRSPEFDVIARSFFDGDFRNPFDVAEKLSRLERAAYARDALAAFLLDQNRQWNASPTTLENIEKLRSPKTMAIVTGQQVGLFSGNLYAIYKTASAIALAKRFKRDFPDYDFVPIFWLEGEDHDYDEVSSVTILVGNEARTLRYDEKNRSERKMVGRIAFSQGIETFVEEFLALLPPSDFKPDVADLLRSAYRKGETFLSAFAKLMNALFQRDGLIFLSPDDAAFKSLAKDVFVKEFETFPKSSAEIVAQSALVEEEGYEVQAKPKPINFYFVDEFGKRWRLEADGERHFVLKPSRETTLKTALLDVVHNAPEKLSPNVVLRPIVQDRALPTLVYVAGPSEVAYWAQLKRAYRFFGVEMPFVAPRASLTLVEPKISKVFEKLGGEFRDARYEQFFFEKESLLKERLAAHSEIRLETLFASVEAEVRSAMSKLDASLKRLDPSLSQTLETAQGKMLFQLGQLKEKAFRAEKQKQSEFVAQLEKCDANLLPMGKMQERALNVVYFLNKYGLSLIQEIQSVIESESWERHVVAEL
ncbi:MAG: bacillithiol biosynthesis cysteine-adding enzyme BshC [Chloroherpetonaceae bacterium]|nr:bacillithiol biosynthesis cysteine-adding enzyme BshC [Chloroherpetonaceae bacterium]MDW8437965.1 bacillithiol biosynthesis cysteine-adding enzyme BshC [Chloroherpetonaceae bacterium]